MKFVPNAKLATIGEDVTALAAAAKATTRPTTKPASASGNRAEAVFAGGCFWCVEAVFEELNGVYDAVSGYAGGSKETANYEAVFYRRNGHAEAVKIIYDPTKISYEKLLEVHFNTHDPRRSIARATTRARNIAAPFSMPTTRKRTRSGVHR